MTASLELARLSAKPAIRRSAPTSRWLVPAFFIGIAVGCAIFSKGFLEADEITHFLNSRSVWYDWTMVLSIWGRMGCTALYALVTPFGVVGARLLAVAMMMLVGWGTTVLLQQFVRGVGRNRTWVSRHGTALAWALLFAQPCFAMNSFTIMTEMLLACCWVWAAVVLMKCRHQSGGGLVLASLLMGLGGLMRPEGWIAIACWPVFVIIWQRAGVRAIEPRGWRAFIELVAATLVAGAPPLFWYLLGVVGKNDWLWVIPQWPWSPKSLYGARAALFVAGAIGSMGVWMWWPIVEGGWAILYKNKRKERMPRSRRRRAAALLLIVPVAGLYLMHGLLGSLGLFGSMSLPRYFISIAPMAAILAIMGLIRIERRLRRPVLKRVLKPALAVTIIYPLFGLATTGIMPTQPSKAIMELDAVADIVAARFKPADYERRLILGHPYIILRLGLPLGTSADRRVFMPEVLRTCGKGMMLVTEPQLWNNEQRPNMEQLHAWGWREDAEAAAKVRTIEQHWDIMALEQDPNQHVVLWVKQ